MIETQYQRALKILTDNRDKLEALAEKLLDKEVIFREDLEEIFGKRAWEPEMPESKVNSENKEEISNSTEQEIENSEATISQRESSQEDSQSSKE